MMQQEVRDDVTRHIRTIRDSGFRWPRYLVVLPNYLKAASRGIENFTPKIPVLAIDNAITRERTWYFAMEDPRVVKDGES